MTFRLRIPDYEYENKEPKQRHNKPNTTQKQNNLSKPPNKYILYNMEKVLSSDEQTIVTLPYFAGMFNLKAILLAVKGIGEIKFKLKTSNNEILKETNILITNGPAVPLVLNNFKKLDKDPNVLILEASAITNDTSFPLTVLATEFVL